MPPTYGTFHLHVKRAHLQSLIFNQADNATIEIITLEHFEWKFDGTRYIAIVTDNPVVPDTVISNASCNCKGNVFLLVFVEWLYDYMDDHIFWLNTLITFVFQQFCLSSC